MVSVARYTTLCLISIKSAEDIMAMHIQWQDSVFFFLFFVFVLFCFYVLLGIIVHASQLLEIIS